MGLLGLLAEVEGTAAKAAQDRARAEAAQSTAEERVAWDRETLATAQAAHADRALALDRARSQASAPQSTNFRRLVLGCMDSYDTAENEPSKVSRKWGVQNGSARGHDAGELAAEVSAAREKERSGRS